MQERKSDCFGVETSETSCENKFEMSETLATFLASTPLLVESWRLCSVANLTFPGSYVVEQIGSVAYVAFSGRQMDSACDQSRENPVRLDAEDGGLFAPLYCRHTETEEPIRVHHGMLKLFLSMHQGLQNQIAELMGKVKTIVVTGHSIGGTTASLSALWLLCHLHYTLPSPVMSVMCVTFGSPLLGNEALRRSILRERWGGNFCHVVSKHDIMPRLLFADIVTHTSKIQALLHFWHFCMASPHLVVAGLSSQIADDVKDVFLCVLKDLEQLTQADEESSVSESLFRPFGSYVFCCQEGAICLENSGSVIKMMHLMLATGSPSCSIEDHLKYGDFTETISNQFLISRNLQLEDFPVSSYEVGVALALQSSELANNSQEPVQDPSSSFKNSNLRKDFEACLQMARDDNKPNLTAANLAVKLSKIVPFRAEIEWYKTLCDEADDQMGYYDSFKVNGGSRRENRVNMNRIKLAGFWNSVILMLENNKLPHDFHRRSKWINASQFYKLLVEPLDIADYYRRGLHHERGHYLQHGRERRYQIFDKWWRDTNISGEGNKRSRFASLTQDSCFWAKVEEARDWLDNLRSEGDAMKRNLLWQKIDQFEAHASKLIEKKEISKDVLAKNSSFSRWMEEIKELKSQVKQFPPRFPGFLDGKVVP